jgi:hypothetical protein
MNFIKLLLIVIFIILLFPYITLSRNKTIESYITNKYNNNTNTNYKQNILDQTLKPPTSNVEYKFQFISNWQILHNNTIINSGGDTGQNIVKGQLPQMKYYDKLKIRIIAGQNKGAFIGVITSDDQIYPTNNKNLKISGQEVDGDGQGLGNFSGGKFLGCYKDQIANSPGINGRALQYNKPNAKTISDCHKEAVNSKQIYYGLQNGNQCWIGSNFAKYGSLPAEKCGERCSSDGGQHSYCGGPLANAVYSTVQPPLIQSFSDLAIGRMRSKEIPTSSEWIVPLQNTLPNSWPDGVWEFVWENIHPPKIPFCNYPQYVQFQPSACSDPTNAYTCSKTVLPNYQVDTNKCKDLYKPSPNLDSDSIFGTLNRAYRKATTYDNGASRASLEEYLQIMDQTYEAACKVLSEFSDKSFSEELCKKRERREQQNLNKMCRVIPLLQRIGPTNITNNLQQCKLGSLECHQLKEECESRSYCFNDYSNEGPRCYLPPKVNKYIDLNSPSFYLALEKASSIVSIPNFSRRSSSVNFNNKKDKLINLARIVEFNTADNQQCGCQEDIYNPNSLKCYPC